MPAIATTPFDKVYSLFFVDYGIKTLTDEIKCFDEVESLNKNLCRRDVIIQLNCDYKNNVDLSKYRNDLEYISTKYPHFPIIVTGLPFMSDDDYAFYKDIKNMIDYTNIIGSNSTCSRLKVGCVITDNKNKNILAKGFNHTQSGHGIIEPCSKHFPPEVRLLPTYNEDHRKYSEKYEIHAEVWAFSDFSKNPNRMRAETDLLNIYTSINPCVNCAKAIVADGRIKTVFFSELYDRSTEGINILNDYGIMTVRV